MSTVNHSQHTQRSRQTRTHHHQAAAAPASHHAHHHQDTFEANQHQPHHHAHNGNGQRLHAPVRHAHGHQGRLTGPGLEGASNHLASPGSSHIAQNAMDWNNKAYKPGQTARCADWVSNVLTKSGAHVNRSDSAIGLAGQGQSVNESNLKPGDMLLFGNTYKKGKYTHVGIYVGNGMFEHRPTANRPVTLSNLNTGYWQSHYSGARRFE